MPKTIIISGFKGGISKSNLAANISAGLAKMGQKVLLVNLDGQNNSLRMLNKDVPSPYRKSILDLLKENRDKVPDVIVPLMEGVDGIASARMQEVNKILSLNEDRYMALYRRMFPAKEVADYDHIIFDSGPGASFINSMILTAADSIILPVQTEFESTDSIKDTFAYLDEIKVPRSKIKLVVPTMVERKNMSAAVLRTLDIIFDPSIITMPIPRRAPIGYAAAYGINIFDYTTEKAILDPFFSIIKKIAELGL